MWLSHIVKYGLNLLYSMWKKLGSLVHTSTSESIYFHTPFFLVIQQTFF